MADKQPKMPDVGPIGQNLIAAVERLREERGLSYRKLSEMLTAIGRPIFPLGLSRLAKGERRVDVDELVALALVFGVNANALLFPLAAGREDVFELTPEVQQRARDVWRWMQGHEPLPPELAEEGRKVVVTPGDRLTDFYIHTAPRGGELTTDPAVREAYSVRALLEEALRDLGNPGTWGSQRESIVRSYRLLGIQLEELISKGDKQAERASGAHYNTALAEHSVESAAGQLRLAAGETFKGGGLSRGMAGGEVVVERGEADGQDGAE